MRCQLKTYTTGLLTVAVLFLGFIQLSIIASNLAARHRAEALLSAIQHVKLGQSREDLQWLLKQYHATRSGASSSMAASLFSPSNPNYKLMRK